MSQSSFTADIVKAFFTSNNQYKCLSDNSFKTFVENVYKNGLKIADVNTLRKYSLLVEGSILVYCTNKRGLNKEFTHSFMKEKIKKYDISMVIVLCFDKDGQIKRLSESQVLKN